MASRQTITDAVFHNLSKTNQPVDKTAHLDGAVTMVVGMSEDAAFRVRLRFDEAGAHYEIATSGELFNSEASERRRTWRTRTARQLFAAYDDRRAVSNVQYILNELVSKHTVEPPRESFDRNELEARLRAFFDSNPGEAIEKLAYILNDKLDIDAVTEVFDALEPTQDHAY